MIYLKNTHLEFDFQYELSFVLVPFIAICYYFYEFLRPMFFHHLACIGLYGTYDNILKQTSHGYLFTFGTIIAHLSLCLALFDINKYGKYNYISFLLLILANIIIIFLPYWPYKINRTNTMYIYNGIYFTQMLIYFIMN
jgi:hypothetical protein